MFFQPVIKAQGRQGSAELFDGLAHHPYLYPEDPLAPANATADWNAFYQTLLIHNLMADAAHGGATGAFTTYAARTN
jgi:hypothetical protein